MIKKLRRKFIITALLSIFGLVTVILVTINVINFSLVENDADRVIQMIMENGGQFNPNEGQNGQNGNAVPSEGENNTSETQNLAEFQPVGPNSPEVSMTMRYFTIKFVDGVGTVEKLNVNIVNEQEAIEWAQTLLNNKQGWTRTYYRYKVWQKDGSTDTYVTILDQSRELSPSFRVLNVSIVGGIVGMILTLIVLIVVSKVFVMPLEKSNRKQRRFINDASDALKNPVTVLETEARIIEANGDTENAELMTRAVDNLKKLVIGLESLVLYDNEKVSENISDFSLSTLTKEVAEIYKHEFEKNNKEIEIVVKDNVNISADKVKITELLNIVLDNAFKYSTSKAIIKLNEEDERKVIEIRNDCKNIEDGDLDSVFERFYRSEDVKESGIDGMGLSLPIAKEIVKLHDGRIKAYGENGMFILKIEL